MRTIILLFIIFVPFTVPAQNNTGIIYPGASFLNYTGDTLFYMPKQKIETLITREEITNKLIQSLKARNTESDSLVSLKTLEAQDWYSKLLESDKLLEGSELVKVKEQQKARRRSKFWFGVGIISGLFIGSIL